jgi:hypothetical protein
MTTAGTIVDIRNSILPELKDREVASAFIADDGKSLTLIFFDGHRVVFNGTFDSASLTRTNGHGGWV